MIYVLTEVYFNPYANFFTLAASLDKEGLLALANSYSENVYVANSPRYKEEAETLHKLKKTYHLIEEFRDICIQEEI